MSERWRGVLAALTNPDLRTVLAEAMHGAAIPDARRRRAIARLVELGLVREAADGGVQFDDAAVRGILNENPPVKRSGPGRFLDAEGRIDRYPAGQTEREELLRWIADRTFEAGEVLSEKETNERLALITADVAVLRRHLVEAGLLERTRSGSKYARVESTER
ncbi:MULTISPECIES: DUF2087 domain-containing protein [Microbacterium]|uniref:DUF2087 domain-containing protein n=1 Tax=Microbacterium TaxID=33882 RepID=UPI001EF40072|nr:DUF2087 domain-containing protein [Microbacterium sp. KCTC 39802]